MLELFKNAAKIRKLFNEGDYVKAAHLLAKTLAALIAEFDTDDQGVMTLKGKKATKADAKQLEKAEAELEGLRQDVDGQQHAQAGGQIIGIIIALLPYVLEFLRRRRGEQPA